jgi:hypothetical protein
MTYQNSSQFDKRSERVFSLWIPREIHIFFHRHMYSIELISEDGQPFR